MQTNTSKIAVDLIRLLKRLEIHEKMMKDLEIGLADMKTHVAMMVERLEAGYVHDKTEEKGREF